MYEKLETTICSKGIKIENQYFCICLSCNSRNKETDYRYITVKVLKLGFRGHLGSPEVGQLSQVKPSHILEPKNPYNLRKKILKISKK